MTSTLRSRLSEELRLLGAYTAFFAAWFLALLVLKWLTLAEYHIRFHGLTAALVAALVLAKVVLLMEHVSLGAWARSKAAWVGVALRTALYGICVIVVMFLETAFEMRHEAGGPIEAVARAVRHEDAPHVLADAIYVTGALLIFNAMSVLRRHLGDGGLWRLFTAPPRAGTQSRD